MSSNLKQDISIGKNLKRLRKGAGLTHDQAGTRPIQRADQRSFSDEKDLSGQDL